VNGFSIISLVSDMPQLILPDHCDLMKVAEAMDVLAKARDSIVIQEPIRILTASHTSP
jgi:hypothetical protein